MAIHMKSNEYMRRYARILLGAGILLGPLVSDSTDLSDMWPLLLTWFNFNPIMDK